MPEGKLFAFEMTDSNIFPGTRRMITVYVPAQYLAEKPACVYVGLDGLGFAAPIVFDNLIHKGEMPVTIAIGVSFGVVLSRSGIENPRFNRSFEFDGLNDSLARCLVEEIFPAVEQRQTPDGLPIKLSRDPNDRCAGGGSTGGIGAFTLAWQRPDQFRRVFSAIGTFVGMRGGDRYPVLVRKTEPKPIRVFQQDGENDQWLGGPEVGDWWMSNQSLDRRWSSPATSTGTRGEPARTAAHATTIFPDAMRYLWKDWPKPIEAQTARTQNVVLKAILDPDSRWEVVSDAGEGCEHLAVNPFGDVFFHDGELQRTRKLDVEGKLGYGPALPAGQAFGFAADGSPVTVSTFNASGMWVTHRSKIYATEAEAGKVWLIRPDGEQILLDEGLKQPTGIALSPDGLWLAVMERSSGAVTAIASKTTARST